MNIVGQIQPFLNLFFCIEVDDPIKTGNSNLRLIRDPRISCYEDLNKIIKKDIHQANVLSDESDNELISSNNRTVNNRYALAKKNDPTAYENTIENAKSSKKDNSNSELNRSLSNLSLKSEMVAQISNKFEEYESEFKLTASKSFKNGF